MNPKLSQLAPEKRERIFNAALEAFSRHGYKKAITTDIAAAAGISKGLLFFYFENKRGLYHWLFDSCVKASLKLLLQEDKWKGMDFFDALELGLKEKMDLARKYPALLGFVMHAWRERDPEAALCMRRYMHFIEEKGITLLLSWLDTSHFRPEADPREVMKLLLYMSEGFLTQQHRKNNFLNITSLQQEYLNQLHLLRRLCYGDPSINDTPPDKRK